jgi:hypothetical protein
MKKIVLFICALISIYSCNTQKKESDLDKAGLKGDVISVFPDVNSYLHPIMEFDNNGNLIRKIDYSDYDNKIFLTETTFNRDSANKVIVENEVNYSNDNELQYYAIRKKYSYQNGKLTTITYQDKFYNRTEKYKYEDDKLTEIKKERVAKNKEQESSIENTTYYYNKNNNLDSTIEIFFNENGDLDSKYIKIYLQNKLLKSEISFYKFSDNTTSHSLREYVYNDKNDIIEEKLTDLQKNKIIYLNKYTYIYDEKNNWIEKSTKYIDSKNKDEVVKRRIFYKGQNYSEFIAKYDLFILKYKSSSVELDGSSSQLEDESPSVSVFQSQENENQVSNNTPQQEEKRKCYSCNGTGQCPKCSKPQRVRYKQGESPNDHNEIRQGMIVCTQCGGNLMNWGADKNKSCYLCKASGWLYCPECNVYGNGNYIGKCQRCKGTGFDN